MSNPLNGTIGRVSLFGQVLRLDIPIQHYKGEPLFISHIAMHNPSTAAITIDDVGPPETTLVLPAGTTGVFAFVKYKANPRSMSDTTTPPLDYGGLPLVIRAALPAPAAGYWNGSEVMPVVEQWSRPPSSARDETRLDFVIMHVVGTDGKLWWLANPALQRQETPSAEVILKDPGTGVFGPFGIETP